MSTTPNLNIKEEVAAVAPPAVAQATGRKRSSLRKFLSAIPGTHAFKWRIQKLIVKGARDRHRILNNLLSLDSETKEQIRPLVRPYHKSLAAINVWETTLTLYFAVLFSIGTLLTFVYAKQSGMTYPLSKAPMPDGWLGFVLTIVTVLMFVGWWFVFLWPIVFANKYKFLMPVSFQIMWVVLAVTGYATALYYLATNLQNWPNSKYFFFAVAIMRGGYMIIGIIFLVLIMLPVISAFNYAFERRTRSLHPQAVISESLMLILGRLDLYEKQWMEPAHRVKIVAGLERAASCLERDLTGQLRAGDTMTDVQVGNATAEMAYAMRSLKQWVLTPKPDTYEHLRQRVAESFLHATRGHWDSLPRATPPKLTLAEGLSSKAGRTVKTLVLGLIPLAALFAVRRLGIPLEGQIAQYATLGVVLWSAVTLLRLIDPNFKATLEAGSTIKNIFK